MKRCEICNKEYKPQPGSRGRFCSLKCSGASRRVVRSPEEKKRLKAEYDREYRRMMGEELKAKHRAYYYAHHERHLEQLAKKRANPAYREMMRDYQREHNARPEWKEHKRKYDRRLRTEKGFGEFAEAASLLIDIDNEIARLCPDRSEIRSRNGTLNKSQRRKRNANSEAQRRHAQGRPLGNAASGEVGQA